MAWLALARVRREQEQAADDVALGCGLDRYAYAGHLLAIVSARKTNGRCTAVATTMASSAKLERRLRVILDANRSRREPGRRAVGLVAAVAAGLLLPLAALDPWGEAHAKVRPSVPVVVPQGPPQAGAAPREAAGGRGRDRVRSPGENPRRLRQAAGRVGASARAPSAGCSRRSTIRTPAYIDARQMADLTRDTQGKLTGIGAQLESRDGQVIVVTPLFGSPALKAGIRAGDLIDEVDGKSNPGPRDHRGGQADHRQGGRGRAPEGPARRRTRRGAGRHPRCREDPERQRLPRRRRPPGVPARPGPRDRLCPDQPVQRRDGRRAEEGHRGASRAGG